MKLYLRGHDYKYAAEQMLLTLFPGQRPLYPDTPPAEGEDFLVLTLTRENGRAEGEARLCWQGKTYTSRDAIPDPGAPGETEADRACQQLLKLCFYRCGTAALGYEPVLLTDQLACEAREAGSFLAAVLKTHAGDGRSLAYIAGGETVVRLTGKGMGGRNQELALAAAPGIAGLTGAAVFSVGSDGTDGPTDAAGGYVDGETLDALKAKDLDVFSVLRENDAYHALRAVDGLVITGATGTNVNDVAVALLRR